MKMSMTKIIKNIVTSIGTDDINPLLVKWDMEVECEEADEDRGNLTRYNEDERSVKKIHSVEVLLFDKQGVDVTDYFTGLGCSPNLKARLENNLIEAVENETIEDLEKEVAI